MKRLEEAIQELNELADESPAEPSGADGADSNGPKRSCSNGCSRIEDALIQLQSNSISLHVLCEALADLGAVLGIWDSDMIRTACENVAEYDRIQGDSRKIIAERQRALRRLLRDEIKEIKRTGAIRHSHL